jgi:hypothetical protein
MPALRSPRPKSRVLAGSGETRRTQTGPAPKLQFALQRDAAIVQLNDRPPPAARLNASQGYGGAAMEGDRGAFPRSLLDRLLGPLSWRRPCHFSPQAHVGCWHCVTSNAGPHGGA